ncbi:unnamed protein product [Nesidiocoris tenuis]|uniref:Uncharacterized protein n=1 Tax=Nesidiocoris tenuis TaxID=355587 RepID=A0A6H5GSJ4_9HEMI|nr:unnamed protein product [Nesidiocoris tenuis]
MRTAHFQGRIPRCSLTGPAYTAARDHQRKQEKKKKKNERKNKDRNKKKNKGRNKNKKKNEGRNKIRSKNMNKSRNKKTKDDEGRRRRRIIRRRREGTKRGKNGTILSCRVLELSRSCPPHPSPVLEFRDVDRAVTDRAVTKHRFFDAPVHTAIFFPKIIIVIETAPRCVRGTEK